jgi:hypothetical protein
MPVTQFNGVTLIR